MEHGPRYRFALVIHARRSVCECGHAFTLKREVRITASSLWKIHCRDKKRIGHAWKAETQEQTLERLEKNRTRMASMRSSETVHVKLHKNGRMKSTEVQTLGTI